MAAENALMWAKGFATSAEVPLELVHAWHAPFAFGLTTLEQAYSRINLNKLRARELLTSRACAAGVHPTAPRTVREGQPGEVLMEATEPGTMIVIGRTGTGTHGVARLAELVIGSTARHCLHHASGPVTVVPERAAWPRRDATIVVGVDGSKASLRALSWAVAMAPADATVTAQWSVGIWDDLAPETLDLDDPEVVEEGRQRLDEWIANVAPSGQPLPTASVVVGDARDDLTVASGDADLVVVGNQSRSPVSRLVLGSVAEHVVRNARCAVAVIPDH